MNSKIKAIVFDFGGTLDTDGVHWAEKFWEVYTHFKISLPKDEFRNAFVYSERKISGIIKQDFSLLQTYKTQINYQLEYLTDKNILTNIDENLVNTLSQFCYKSTTNNIPITKSILENLKNNFQLGLVSNYYGNVKTVLTELGVANYFDAIVDSTIIGIRKPDSKIFEHIITKLNVNSEEVIVVGDSYKNDIAPSKLLGCKTVWIKVKGWNNSEIIEDADVIIKSIKELPDAINKI
jgi:putative hydrolase of the HAD superfamily